MKVTDGALTPEFRRLRLPLGTGLLGLVAQTGAAVLHRGLPARRAVPAPGVHRHRGRRREDPGHPRRPADRRGHGDRRAARGAPQGAAVPARRGVAADVVRRARRGGPGERPAVRAARPGQPAGARAGRGRRGRRRRPRPAHRRAAARRRRRRGRRRARPTCCTARSSCSTARGTGWPATAPARCSTGSTTRSREARCLGPQRRGGRPGGPSYVAVALAGTEHLGTLRAARPRPRARPRRPADPRARGAGHRAGAAVRRSVAEAEERVRGELLSDLLERRDLDEARLRERARRQRADLDGAARWSRWPPVEGVERHRAAQVAARLGGELQRPRRRARRPGGAGRAGRGRRSRWAGSCASGCDAAGGSCTVGVAPRAGGPDGRGRRRTPRPGAAWTRCSRWAAPARSATRPGSGWPGCCSGRTAPRSSTSSSRATVGPVLAYDERRGTELVGHPGGVVRRRRAARGDRRSGCTCTRTPSPSGSTGSARCSARTGATRPAASTSSWRCGCAGSRRRDATDRDSVARLATSVAECVARRRTWVA